MEINTQPECRPFVLSPKPRKYIYELVFASSSTTVNMLEASSPPKDLTMTCRRLHEEAGGLYNDQYRSYWSDTKFIIDVSEGNLPQAQTSTPERVVARPLGEEKKAKVYARLQELLDEDVAHITKVQTYWNNVDRGWIFGEPSEAIWSLWLPISRRTGM